jgi:integrase
MTTKRRRQAGEGSIFRKTEMHRGQERVRWCGLLDLGYGPDGKRRRRTVYGPSAAAVSKKLALLKRDLAERGDLPTAEMTVGKWLDYWLEQIAAQRVKPGTLRGYQSVVNGRLKPTVGRYRLGQLSAQHVHTMHTTLAGQGLSSTTVLQAHRVLSSALAEAVRWNRAPRNICALVRAPGRAPNPRGAFTVPEAHRILMAAADDPRLASGWLCALMLGLRQGERLGLRWSNVNLQDGLLDVAWSLQRVPRDKTGELVFNRNLEHHVLHGNLVLFRPKSDASIRVVPLPAVIHAALIDRWNQTTQERAGYTADLDLVWCRPDGTPIPHKADWDQWKALLDQAGVPARTLHEARNTAATLLFEAGVDQGVIKTILGHSEVTTTRGYQRVSVELARRGLDQVGSRLELT